MATNPMHQFEVYKIGPEIKISGINLAKYELHKTR